ncbi:7sk snRNA methylphosphate capping enzyme [Anaeramoeba flamelloides]|uniref:RNA methyltransferase n=1 Tax=Anaeramoeba flamelloides TaxID=1746091 RepID=A0ABQ8XJY3_9EUKA|nr:7sk snRNA methylphosphate capping enzyme [Anaeramoeba flamelloides]
MDERKRTFVSISNESIDQPIEISSKPPKNIDQPIEISSKPPKKVEQDQQMQENIRQEQQIEKEKEREKEKEKEKNSFDGFIEGLTNTLERGRGKSRRRERGGGRGRERGRGRGGRRGRGRGRERERGRGRGRGRGRKTSRESNKHNNFYKYGNYPRYYGYRETNYTQLDLRIQELSKQMLKPCSGSQSICEESLPILHFFQDKRCLDIGCNSGRLTLQIGYNFKVKSMLGVDIDDKLIRSARNEKRLIESRKERSEQHKTHLEINKLIRTEISQQLGIKEEEIPLSLLYQNEYQDKFSKRILNSPLLPKIRFLTENYTDIDPYQKEIYDAITCFSVTKWIQLNSGDEGIHRLFRRVSQELTKGGIFILEPQPLSSYKKKKNFSQLHKLNFEKMEIKPKNFSEVLVETYKFVPLAVIDVKHPSKGFSRPILIFQKPFF